MITEKKYNYVYEIVYPNGMKYLGVRSCNESALLFPCGTTMGRHTIGY
jgi:hypothetical protein